MKKILIVDDLAENLFLLESILKAQYEVTTASNGEEALVMALSTPHDLIISDILMPVMDGFSLIRECKNNKLLKDIPFIFYTGTYTNFKDKAFALSLGADDFLIKPTPKNELLEAIEKVLSKPQSLDLKAAKELKDDSEKIILKEYNQILIHKLEDKMFQTEKALSELKIHTLRIETEIEKRKKTELELRNLQTNLEEIINERTRDLTTAKENAEKADFVKSAFLASMSHELRTPLNSIIGFTGILLKKIAGELNQEQEKQLKIIAKSSKHLLSLINDVLDISKIEAGELQLNISSFRLSDTINKCVTEITPLADNKQLKIINRINLGDQMLLSDERRVEQVLLNLLGNAVKFTDKGSITIESYLADKSVITHIIDTGIGIKNENLDKLFKPFSQVQNGISRSYEGTGLGLSISDKITAKLNGSLTVKSSYGIGSIFTFKLPL